MAYLKAILSTTKDWQDLATDLFAVGVTEETALTATGAEVNEYLDHQISEAIKLGDIKGKVGEAVLFYKRAKALFNSRAWKTRSVGFRNLARKRGVPLRKRPSIRNVNTLP